MGASKSKKIIQYTVD